MEITKLVETVSRKLAPTKSEMRIVLEQWKANAEQDNIDPAYQASLDRALKVLDKSMSVPQMIQKLKQQEKQ